MTVPFSVSVLPAVPPRVAAPVCVTVPDNEAFPLPRNVPPACRVTGSALSATLSTVSAAPFATLVPLPVPPSAEAFPATNVPALIVVVPV